MKAPALASTTVLPFSRVRLRSGAERRIGIVSRPGDSPALSVALFDERGALLTRTLFRGNCELSVLSDAIGLARDPTLRGRANAGVIQHGAELRVHVWAIADGTRCPAVCFGRRTLERHVGGVTTIAGSELDALEQATRQLQELTAAEPAEGTR
jgi:hypothetical protein